MPARRFNKSTAVKYRLLDICAAVCGCALAAALVFYVIFSPFFITESGLCDFAAGDCVLADRVGKYVFGFSRGDSVIYRTVTLVCRKVAIFTVSLASPPNGKVGGVLLRTVLHRHHSERFF